MRELTKKEVIELAKTEEVKMIDFKVVDFPGRWHHITVPVSYFKEEIFEEGIGIDASSYPGYKKVEAGDMKIIPDPTTAIIDSFLEPRTMSIICDVIEADKSEYLQFPRSVLKKAERFLLGLNKGQILFSPELEFHIFDDIRYASEVNMGFYQIDSIEAFWNTGRQENPNLGYKFAIKGGYHAIPPGDTLHNLRAEMVQDIENAGISVKYHHHEVGSAGQVEIEVPFGTPLDMADAVMWMKYIIKNVAYRAKKTVTFMPKPLYGEAGNGMHVHQYLSDVGTSLFYDESAPYAKLSKLALNYIGGIHKHGKALLAFTNPSTNSYKRLVPGYEAPVNNFFSLANRTAAIRIPAYSINPCEHRIEFRPPDATCNIYYAFAAMLMAAADGIQNQIDPMVEGFGPYDINIEHTSAEQKAKIEMLPTSLDEALNELKKDYEFLLKGGVFTEDLINNWIEWKTIKEFYEVSKRPHPHEFGLYYDC